MISPSNLPRISIITVNYNCIDFLGSCLDSVESQTYPNIEHIVVDGGSSDGCVELLKSRVNSTRIDLVSSDNGIYDAMNKGIQIASGHIIGFLNSDDVFASDHIISDIANRFVSDSSICCVYGSVHYVSRDNTFKKLRKHLAFPLTPFYVALGFFPPHPAFYCLKDCIVELSGFNTDFKIAADADLLSRFSIHFPSSYSIIDKNVVLMRIGGTSNNSLANIVRGNKEIILSLKTNFRSFNLFFFLFVKILYRSFLYFLFFLKGF